MKLVRQSPTYAGKSSGVCPEKVFHMAQAVCVHFNISVLNQARGCFYSTGSHTVSSELAGLTLTRPRPLRATASSLEFCSETELFRFICINHKNSSR